MTATLTSSTLNEFRIGGKCYHHFIDRHSGCTYLDDEAANTLYVVDSHGCMTDRAGSIGKFSITINGYWYFTFLSGVIITTNNKRFSKAEMKVFTHLLSL